MGGVKNRLVWVNEIFIRQYFEATSTILTESSTLLKFQLIWTENCFTCLFSKTKLKRHALRSFDNYFNTVSLVHLSF